MAADTEPILTPDLLAKLERMELVSRKMFRGRMKGERRSLRRGQGVELADYRDYVPGDDIRFVDWNSYARLDRLFLKLFLEEEDLHVYPLVDASRSMDFGEPTKFQAARRLAAALGFIGLVRGDRVKIATLGARGPVPVFRGRRSLPRMLDYLAGITPDEPVVLAESLKRFAVRESGQGIVILISDLLDKGGFESALRYLLARPWDIYVVHMLAEEDVDPQLQGDVRLVDSEDGDVREISANAALLRRYRRTAEAFIHAVREYCTRRNIVYVPARNDMPVDRLIGGYLRQRGLVR
ncbi:DUF58 domain-containing protein [Thermostilla marina]